MPYKNRYEKYRKAHPEKVSATKKAWRKKYKKEIQEYMRDYREKHKKHLREHTLMRQRERKNWFREYKKTLKCNRCPACLDFHHIDDNKEAGVSTMINRSSIERILREIAKCEVLCSNCHRKEHYDYNK